MKKQITIINHIIAIALLVFLNNLVYSQTADNKIDNGGFESGSAMPSGPSDADRLFHWRTRTSPVSGGANHSPDWFHTAGWDAFSRPTHSGNGKLGMFNYELIQQPIAISDDQFYILTLYIKPGNNASLYPPDFNGSTLNVYIA